MSHDAACADLIRKGFGTRIITRETTIATVEEAAATVGVGVERIAKTLSFLQNGRPVLIVAAGNVKIDNRKYKDRFGAETSSFRKGRKRRTPFLVESKTWFASQLASVF